MFAGDEAACATAVTSNGQLVYLDGELVEKVPIDHDGLLAVMGRLHDVADSYLVVEYEGEKVAVDADLGFVLAHPDNFWSVEQALASVPERPCYKANIRVVGSFERCQEVATELARAPARAGLRLPDAGHAAHRHHAARLWQGPRRRLLMERLGLTPDEVCCFGDAENDLAVLRHYANSVAVANAVPVVRETARYHIGPADEESRGARPSRHRGGHERRAHAGVHV